MDLRSLCQTDKEHERHQNAEQNHLSIEHKAPPKMGK